MIRGTAGTSTQPPLLASRLRRALPFPVGLASYAITVTIQVRPVAELADPDRRSTGSPCGSTVRIGPAGRAGAGCPWHELRPRRNAAECLHGRGRRLLRPWMRCPPGCRHLELRSPDAEPQALSAGFARDVCFRPIGQRHRVPIGDHQLSHILAIDGALRHGSAVHVAITGLAAAIASAIVSP